MIRQECDEVKFINYDPVNDILTVEQRERRHHFGDSWTHGDGIVHPRFWRDTVGIGREYNCDLIPEEFKWNESQLMSIAQRYVPMAIDV